MYGLRRIPRPSRRNSVIAAALLLMLFSAYIVGDRYVPREGPITLSGYGYSRSDSGETTEHTSSIGDATAAVAAAEAASVAAGAS